MKPEIDGMFTQLDRSGEGKKYLINTLGCQMNEHDSEVIAGMLENIGYSAVQDPAEADLIIINTCAVRKKPEDKVASLLGKYLAFKDSNKDLLIAVGGCMSQQEEVAVYIKERFHHVDLVFGTHALPRLPQLLEQARKQRGTFVDIANYADSRASLPVLPGRKFQAWLPVIYGCNNYCSYCVVPFVRGRERSRPLEEVLTEARALADRGYLELTLLGQNVNSYGQDRSEKHTFADLLEELDRIKGLVRIRFMTSHPKDLSRRLVEVVQRGKRICEHFHLPVQSGSNRILELMNRGYTSEHYLDLVESIRNAIPGAAITSDIIIGFPGEEEDDFRQTVELVEKARFDNAFSFLYSPRKKTAAAQLKDNNTHAIKQNRLQRLNDLQHRISKEANLSLIDQTVELLVEGVSKNKPEMQTGRTRTNKLVHFAGTDNLEGKLVHVKITKARTWSLVGEMLKEV
ncbi:MAG TPA: tRNA (N6-isopentenyl adenosine(37)-C2)-methylthiotransferase MiaB [Candidatus Limnocylindrales bacterium]|nr:tRNA (N6-isopentenyl adenosine(37)-C2)-methylthiotransferase MiaB [Candidatus Limnocylindrales bacterium]